MSNRGSDIEEKSVAELSLHGVFSELDEVDRAIIQYKISEPAIKITEIGKRLGYSREGISQRLKKVKLQNAIAQLQKSAWQLVLDASGEAIRTTIRLMRHENPMVALRACESIMRFYMEVSPDKTPSDDFNFNVTITQINNK